MSALILFSIKRRFLNKTNKIFLVVLTLVSLCLCFIDKIVSFFNISFQNKISIFVEGMDNNLFNPELFEINADASIKLVLKEGKVYVYSQQELSKIEQTIIQSEIHKIAFQNTKLIPIQFEFEQPATHNDHALFLVSIIYFMMLSYASMLSNEVVAEKTSNILELIGTSVSLSTHYYSKIIIGYLSILLQTALNGLAVFTGVLIRFLFDDGRGLLSFLKSIGFFTEIQSTFSQIFKNYFFDLKSIGLLLVSILFLFMGMLLVQLILLMLCSKIKTIEEASSLQSPVYLLLIGIYYVSLFTVNVKSLNGGIGLIGSFLPISSMIFMPSQILLGQASILMIITAFCLNLSVLVFVILKGERKYINNVLSFTNFRKSS